ncbi:MAG: sugar ABC transporter substrate-binding protein [Lachnospiraceae bacterium]|nr:sugar ABC transporter substrate-binding protein [Lachnospiraceae bacterium]
MKKKVLALVLASAMAASMAACGSSSDTATEESAAASEAASEAAEETEESGEAAASTDYKIDVILKTTASEYWGYVMAGAKAASEELGVEVDVKGATSETAYDEQQNMIETDLNSGAYDAIVIAPLQGDQVATLIAGTDTPIFAVDTNIDAPEVISFVGTGNVAAATQGGEKAVELAKEAGWEEIKAIEIAGVQGDQTNSERMEGYAAGINGAGGEFLEDETQYADGVADKAVTAMEAIMQKYPEGVAIIVANNDDMASAAARVAKADEAYANTVFVGFDGNKAACESILAGGQTMSVTQNAYGMGYMVVEAALNYLNGEEQEAFIEAPAGTVDASNAEERMETLAGYLE